MLSVTGNIGGGRQSLGLDIKNYSPGANPIYKQVSGEESVKEEQGKVVGIGEDLYSASVNEINPALGFGTRIVYDDKGKPQLVPSRWRTKRRTAGKESDTDCSILSRLSLRHRLRLRRRRRINITGRRRDRRG